MSVYAHICALCHKVIKRFQPQDGMFICDVCLGKMRKAAGVPEPPRDDRRGPGAVSGNRASGNTGVRHHVSRLYD